MHLWALNEKAIYLAYTAVNKRPQLIMLDADHEAAALMNYVCAASHMSGQLFFFLIYSFSLEAELSSGVVFKM